jgi:methyl-accepting chemotaxis protein
MPILAQAEQVIEFGNTLLDASTISVLQFIGALMVIAIVALTFLFLMYARSSNATAAKAADNVSSIIQSNSGIVRETMGYIGENTLALRNLNDKMNLIANGVDEVLRLQEDFPERVQTMLNHTNKLVEEGEKKRADFNHSIDQTTQRISENEREILDRVSQLIMAIEDFKRGFEGITAQTKEQVATVIEVVEILKKTTDKTLREVLERIEANNKEKQP